MVASPEAVLLLSCRTVQPKDIAPQDLVLVDPKESPSDRPKEQTPPVASNDTFRFQHMPELDGFRGLAILFVVVGHYWEFHGSSGVGNLAQSIAHLGVLLFFVLSGFSSRVCFTENVVLQVPLALSGFTSGVRSGFCLHFPFFC